MKSLVLSFRFADPALEEVVEFEPMGWVVMGEMSDGAVTDDQNSEAVSWRAPKMRVPDGRSCASGEEIDRVLSVHELLPHAANHFLALLLLLAGRVLRSLGAVLLAVA